MKTLGFILATLLVFGAMVATFYGLSVFIRRMAIFHNPPATAIIWIVILGVATVLTTRFMRAVYFILNSDRER